MTDEKCRHGGGTADCQPVCLLIYGDLFVTERPPPRLPLRVRWWLWRHRRHGTPHINTTISVPSWDPGALGILTRCPCGKEGAW